MTLECRPSSLNHSAKFWREFLPTVCLVGINTRIFVWVGINTGTFENIPFALNDSAKYVSISSYLATNCPGPPESSLATLHISPTELPPSFIYHNNQQHHKHHHDHGEGGERLLQMPPV